MNLPPHVNRTVEVSETHPAMVREAQRKDRSVVGIERIAGRYGAYQRRLNSISENSTNRCDTHYLSPWMAVVDAASVEHYEKLPIGQDILELHFRISGAIE